MLNAIKRLKEYIYLDCEFAKNIAHYINCDMNSCTHDRMYELIKKKKYLRKLISEMKVQHGPFEGMRYSSLQSAGSALYPKLLGSYERELTDIVNLITSTEYSEIIDIGCAEGYYAVGFAYLAELNQFKTKIYAYDIDQRARKLCKQMAYANKVTNRVIINCKCTNQTLSNFKFTGKNLIISDCEGYERELFDNKSITNLSNSDVLIEVHDFDMSKNYKTSNFEYLINLFKNTHKYEIINSVEDYDKVYKYKYKELSTLSNHEKLYILSERSFSMRWLFFKPLN